MIHVIAIITAKPGKRDEILKNFKANVPAVHAEKGCIEYGATVDTDGGAVRQVRPRHLRRDREVGEHGRTQGPWRFATHMKAYGAKNKDLVANRAVHVLQNA